MEPKQQIALAESQSVCVPEVSNPGRIPVVPVLIHEKINSVASCRVVG